MPNGMSEEAQSRGHAVWEGAPCKGALYPISRLQTGSEGFLCMNVVHLSPRYPAIGDRKFWRIANLLGFDGFAGEKRHQSTGFDLLQHKNAVKGCGRSGVCKAENGLRDDGGALFLAPTDHWRPRI